MKYDTLLKNVAAVARESVIRGKGWGEILVDLTRNHAALIELARSKHPDLPVPRAAILVAADMTYDIILSWDIRMVGRLRELFRDEFPPSLREGPLYGEYDEAGDWVVRKGGISLVAPIGLGERKHRQENGDLGQTIWRRIADRIEASARNEEAPAPAGPRP